MEIDHWIVNDAVGWKAVKQRGGLRSLFINSHGGMHTEIKRVLTAGSNDTRWEHIEREDEFESGQFRYIDRSRRICNSDGSTVEDHYFFQVTDDRKNHSIHMSINLDWEGSGSPELFPTLEVDCDKFNVSADYDLGNSSTVTVINRPDMEIEETLERIDRSVEKAKDSLVVSSFINLYKVAGLLVFYPEFTDMDIRGRKKLQDERISKILANLKWRKRDRILKETYSFARHVVLENPSVGDPDSEEKNLFEEYLRSAFLRFLLQDRTALSRRRLEQTMMEGKAKIFKQLLCKYYHEVEKIGGHILEMTPAINQIFETNDQLYQVPLFGQSEFTVFDAPYLEEEDEDFVDEEYDKVLARGEMNDQEGVVYDGFKYQKIFSRGLEIQILNLKPPQRGVLITLPRSLNMESLLHLISSKGAEWREVVSLLNILYVEGSPDKLKRISTGYFS